MMGQLSMGRMLAVAAALLALLAAPAAVPGAAAQGTTTILVRDFACATASPGNVWEDCDAIWGITYAVSADGATVAGSPYTTVQDMGIGHGVGVEVPADATSVTLTATGGIPAGYAPAPGYSAYTADIAALPEVGFGGESTGPGISMIYVATASEPEPDESDSGDEDGDDSAGGVTTLPETGTGAASADGAAAAAGLLGVALVLALAGHAVRRGNGSGAS